MNKVYQYENDINQFLKGNITWFWSHKDVYDQEHQLVLGDNNSLLLINLETSVLYKTFPSLEDSLKFLNENDWEEIN